MALRYLNAMMLAALLVLHACASTPEWGPGLDDGGGGGLPDDNARERHWAFILRKERELRQSGGSDADRRREQLVLAEMTVWMHGQDVATLARTAPEDLYFQLRAARRQQERQEEERAAAVELKLDEFFNWALHRWEESAIRFRSVGREYLMTEHPLR